MLVALGLAGCPDKSESKAEGTPSAEPNPRPPESEERGGKRYSTHSEHFKVGQAKEVDGKRVRLVSVRRKGESAEGHFRTGGKDYRMIKGECFEAGKHHCSTHEAGTTKWCVSAVWETGGVIAPQGHH